MSDCLVVARKGHMRTNFIIASLAVLFPVSDLTAQDGCAGYTVGGLAVMGLVIYDIATAPSSARWYNTNRLTVSPVLDPINQSFGLAFSVPLPRAHRPTPRAMVSGSQSGGRKSGKIAFLWSLGATVAPVVAAIALSGPIGDAPELAGTLAVIGVTFGPSAGHWYAERIGRGFATVGARIAVFALGAAASRNCSFG